MEITIKEIDTVNSTAELEITMRDNLGYLKLMLWDSQIYEYDYPLVIVEPVEKTITHRVNIEDENRFSFTLIDMAKNETIKEIIIGGAQPMEELPINTTIVGGDEAFDMKYLSKNRDAQIKLINWTAAGGEIYIKPSKGVIINSSGKIVGIDRLPNELIYYDANGETTRYIK